jgi:hypothetical protein
VGTGEIAYFGNVIPGIFDLRSYSWLRRSWTLATLSDSKLLGRNGFTRASRTVSTTTKLANPPLEPTARIVVNEPFLRSGSVA